MRLALFFFTLAFALWTPMTSKAQQAKPSTDAVRASAGVANQAVGTQVRVATREPTPYMTTQELKVREQPAATAPVVGELPKGAAVTVTGDVTGTDWVQVSHNDSAGYVWGPLLKPKR